MRTFLISALLCLPFLAGAASGAGAQGGPTVAPPLSSPLYEGETRTYRITGIPANVDEVELREGAGTTAESFLHFFVENLTGGSILNQFEPPSNGSLTFVVNVVEDFSSRTAGDKAVDLEMRMWDDAQPVDTVSLGVLTLKDGARPAGPPEVTISGGGSVTEGGNAVFTLTALPAAAVTVSVSVTDSGGFAASGQTGTRRVAIDASGTATLTVGTRDDDRDEPNGRITARVNADTGSPVRWRPGSPATASVTVNDDDGAPATAGVNVAPTVLSLAEGSGPETYTVALTKAPAPGDTVTVTATVSPDTVATLSAGGGAAARSASLTFTGANWDRAQTVTVAPRDDDDAADGRARIVHRISGGGEYSAATARSVLVQVADDEEEAVPSLPLVTVTGGGDVDEGARAVFTIRAHPAPESPLTVNILIRETGDAQGANYVRDALEGEKTVRLRAGQGEVEYRLPTQGNARRERNEAVIVEIGSGDGYRVPDSRSHRSAWVGVRDDDSAGVSASTNRLELTEGAQGSYTLRLFTNPRGTVNVTPVSADPSVATVSGPLTFHGGNWWRAQTVTVTAANDEDSDPGRTIIDHRVSGYGDLAEGPVVTALVSDRSVPATPVAFFATASSAAAEGAGTRRIRVNLNPAPQETLTLRYRVGGTAAPGGDFDALSGAVPVFFGATHVDIEVPVVDDGVQEPDETVLLTLAPGAGYAVGSNSTHTLTIDDGLPTRITIAGGDDVVEGGTAEFTIRAAPAPASALTVRIRVDEIGGASHVDAAEEGVKTVRLRAGQSELSYFVPTVDTVAAEPDGSVLVRVLPGDGYRAPAAPRDRFAIVGVRDDDNPGVSASVKRLEVTEGTQESYTLRLDTDPGGTVTVTPVPDSPRLIALSGPLTFDSRNWSEAQTVTVTGKNDADARAGRTAIGHKVSGYGSVTRGPSVHVLVIDDDAPPAASFALPSSTADEGAGTLDVRIDLKPAPASAITLVYSVGGTATSGDDYTALAGTVAVDANAGSVIIPLAIVNDSVGEADETVVLTLTAGEGYRVGGPHSHTLTIADDGDAPPPLPVASFAAAASSVAEVEGAGHVVRVSLSPAPASAITLAYSVGGTATSGDDYGAAAGTVAVDAGASGATIPVAIVDDSEEEADETVVLTLTAGAGYRVGSPDSHTLTIGNDDTAEPPAEPEPAKTPVASFSAASSTAVESAGTRNIGVNLNPAPTSAITLSYRVGGTAASGDDYTALAGTVAVGAGASGATIPVAIADDDAVEGGETLVLTLTAGDGYTLC